LCEDKENTDSTGEQSYQQHYPKPPLCKRRAITVRNHGIKYILLRELVCDFHARILPDVYIELNGFENSVPSVVK